MRLTGKERPVRRRLALWDDLRKRRQRKVLQRRASTLKTFVICSTHRTGSTLLCQLLGDTGLCGFPEEFFSRVWAPRFARDLSGAGSARRDWEPEPRPDRGEPGAEKLDHVAYLMELYDKRSTSNDVWGCKIQWPHTRRIWEEFQHRSRRRMEDSLCFRLIEEIFAHPKYVWIRRNDKVRQAISFWRSKQTKLYTTSREPRPDGTRPVFDFDKIHGFVERFRRQDEAWGRLLQHSRVQPLVLVFEDFRQQLDRTVLEVLAHVGVRPPAGFAVPRPRLRKLSDGLNDEWYERYHSILSRGEACRPADGP